MSDKPFSISEDLWAIWLVDENRYLGEEWPILFDTKEAARHFAELDDKPYTIFRVRHSVERVGRPEGKRDDSV